MATLQDRNGVSVTVTVRMSGYPTRSKTFKYAENGGKRAATKTAKDWGKSTEVAMKKLDPVTLRKGSVRTFVDVIDVYLQTRAGIRLNDDTPREALIRFKADRSNACVPLGDKKPMRGGSLNAAVSMLEWWGNWFDGKPLSDITADDVMRALDFLNDGKRRPATVNRYQSYAHAAFNLVVAGRRNRHEWIDRNPAPLGKLREDNRREVVLSDRQAARLIKACEKSECEDIHLVVLLAIATGMRQGNIMMLKWEWIDLRSGRVDIPAKSMKSGKRFSTWIAGDALDALKARRKAEKAKTVQNLFNGEWVFPSGRTRSHRDFPVKAWYAALDQAGIDREYDPDDRNSTGFRFHDLRHTFATRMAAKKGASQQKLMKMLGHSSPAMTTRYVEMDIDDTKDLFD